jgi:hypothetical protein
VDYARRYPGVEKATFCPDAIDETPEGKVRHRVTCGRFSVQLILWDNGMTVEQLHAKFLFE